MDYLHSDKKKRRILRTTGGLRKVKSELVLGKEGPAVTTYRAKVEKAQADAIQKSPEAVAQTMLVNKDISDIQRKKLLLEHIMVRES